MNENSKPTQVKRVIEYMQKYGEIDQMTALTQLGVMRLASRISEIKKLGYKVKKRMKSGKGRLYGDEYSVAVYSLESEAV